MIFPETLDELLKRIACETARMSYPGSMSRGKKQVVKAGTKRKLEDYFVSKFPMSELWASADKFNSKFEKWHSYRVNGIAKAIEGNVSSHNNSKSVAAKFLNTFMHQLMKYEPFRPLWPSLHLPLDRRVFQALRKIQSPALDKVRLNFLISPYVLPYVEHRKIQKALCNYVDEINRSSKVPHKIGSRIELNWMWL